MTYFDLRIPDLQKRLAAQVKDFDGTGQLKERLLITVAETPILGELKATFIHAHNSVDPGMAMDRVVAQIGATSPQDKAVANYVAAIVAYVALSHNDVISYIIDITGDLEKSEDDAAYGYRPH